MSSSSSSNSWSSQSCSSSNSSNSVSSSSISNDPDHIFTTAKMNSVGNYWAQFLSVIDAPVSISTDTEDAYVSDGGSYINAKNAKLSNITGINYKLLQDGETYEYIDNTSLSSSSSSNSHSSSSSLSSSSSSNSHSSSSSLSSSSSSKSSISNSNSSSSSSNTFSSSSSSYSSSSNSISSSSSSNSISSSSSSNSISSSISSSFSSISSSSSSISSSSNSHSSNSLSSSSSQVTVEGYEIVNAGCSGEFDGKYCNYGLRGYYDRDAGSFEYGGELIIYQMDINPNKILFATINLGSIIFWTADYNTYNGAKPAQYIQTSALVPPIGLWPKGSCSPCDVLISQCASISSSNSSSSSSNSNSSSSSISSSSISSSSISSSESSVSSSSSSAFSISSSSNSSSSSAVPLAGASLVNSARGANGNYCQAGVYNGNPYYQNDTPDGGIAPLYMWWSNNWGGYWWVGPDLGVGEGTNGIWYFRPLPSYDTPPDGTWNGMDGINVLVDYEINKCI